MKKSQANSPKPPASSTPPAAVSLPANVPLIRSMASVKRRVSSALRWCKVLQDGLDGHPHRLGSGEAAAMEKLLARLDIYLTSRTAASKDGRRLRRGAKALVTRYYDAPISAYRELFSVEQFRDDPKQSETARPSALHSTPEAGL